MITVRVFLENNDFFVTGINCTFEEAIKYYMTKKFNFGIDGDKILRVNRVELLEESK